MITDREVVKSYIDAVSDMTGNDGKAKALEALDRLCALQSQSPAKPEPRGDALTVEAVNAGLAVGFYGDRAARQAIETCRNNPFAHIVASTVECEIHNILASSQGQGDAYREALRWIVYSAKLGMSDSEYRKWAANHAEMALKGRTGDEVMEAQLGEYMDKLEAHPQPSRLREALENARDVLGCANPSSYFQLKDAVVSGLGYVEDALAALAQADREAQG